MHSFFEKIFISSCFRLKYLKHSSHLGERILLKFWSWFAAPEVLFETIQRQHWMAVEACSFVCLASGEESAAGEGRENKGHIWFCFQNQNK